MSQSSRADHPATNESTNAPPLAIADFLARCMGSADIAILVLAKFESQLKADVLEIEQRLALHDAAQIARTAHALKGSAGAASATALHKLAASIETLARQDQVAAIAEEFAALRAEVDRCLGYLPTARDALKSGTCGGPAENTQ